MADGHNRYDALFFFDASDDTIVAYAVAPKAGQARAFLSLITLARMIEAWQLVNNEF